MHNEETLYTIALSLLPRLKMQDRRALMRQAGSAKAVYENRNDLQPILTEARTDLTDVLGFFDAVLPRAQEELEFAESHHIQCICMGDHDYPKRLAECPDAPVILFYSGNADLNAPRILSIVGTRKITEYGKDLCRHLMEDLSQICPDTLIISGLAYGVDIHAHRAALDKGMQTIGVLAHGLDQIYPRLHKETAAQMASHGGLLTEFPSRTNADKRNFVQRNRIVAGISDAVVVIESANKGGSLITASIANSYSRDVFAFPGRVRDAYSMGCNRLIRTQAAQLITCGQELAEYLNWADDAKLKRLLRDGIPLQFEPELDPIQQQIYDTLHNTDPKHVNTIAEETGLTIKQVTSTLMLMAMNGVVRSITNSLFCKL